MSMIEIKGGRQARGKISNHVFTAFCIRGFQKLGQNWQIMRENCRHSDFGRIINK